MNNGVSKTLQLITLVRYKKKQRNLKHCLIRCGINSLKWNWVKEVKKFCKDEEAIVLGVKQNSKGKYVPITVEETKEQIELIRKIAKEYIDNKLKEEEICLKDY